MKPEKFKNYIRENPAVLLYISTEDCNVCKSLKPKVKELLKTNFPKMKFVYIESNSFPEVPAQLQVFTVPTILAFFDGKEHLRKSRYIGVEELASSLQRTYGLMF